MKLFPTRMRPSTLLMLACFGVGVSASPALAAPPASTDPTIVNLAANVLQNDGSYLWQYRVTSGTRPSLSHWVLGIDNSLLPNLSTVIKSVSENYEIRLAGQPDPTTNATGIKFANGYQGGDQRIVSFYLLQSYTAVNQTATFKSGNDPITTQSVVAPGVRTNSAVALPEPSTLGLLAIAPLAVGVVRRRRAK